VGAASSKRAPTSSAGLEHARGSHPPADPRSRWHSIANVYQPAIATPAAYVRSALTAARLISRGGVCRADLAGRARRRLDRPCIDLRGNRQQRVQRIACLHSRSFDGVHGAQRVPGGSNLQFRGNRAGRLQLFCE
jgi:hypothetical protein